jgi:hypothetical protein
MLHGQRVQCTRVHDALAIALAELQGGFVLLSRSEKVAALAQGTGQRLTG